MPAFNRRPVSAYAKARLLEAYTNEEDFVEIARVFKVNQVTSYTIIPRLNRMSSMSHGGHRYQKVDDEVFVDEFGVNIHTKRSFGRSTRGTRAHRTVSGQAGANVTVCLGVCATYGIVFHEIYHGGTTMVRFSSFLDYCCGNVIAENAATG